jgi:hypothetical protein
VANLILVVARTWAGMKITQSERWMFVKLGEETSGFRKARNFFTRRLTGIWSGELCHGVSVPELEHFILQAGKFLYILRLLNMSVDLFCKVLKSPS